MTITKSQNSAERTAAAARLFNRRGMLKAGAAAGAIALAGPAYVKNALSSNFPLTLLYQLRKSASHCATSWFVVGRGLRLTKFCIAQEISSARSSMTCCFLDQTLKRSDKNMIARPRIKTRSRVQPSKSHAGGARQR